MNGSVMSSTSATTKSNNQDDLLEKLEVFKIQGRDKQGRKILRIIGKFFPARALSGPEGEEALRGYLERHIFPSLEGAPYCIVYVHTGVQRADNFPGVATLRSLHETLSPNLRSALHAIYFLHPGLQARLFLATLGRLLFSQALYAKVKYVSRVDFLWEHVRRRGEVEMPEFVYDHDEKLEYRPLMDYGLESDHHRVPVMDSPTSVYSLRCIA